MSAKRVPYSRRLLRKLKPSVGKLLVILMLAYFVFAYFSFKDKTEVSYYEVEEGSLVKEHNYTGLILREEEIFPAEANGYIYYYVADGRKTAKGTPVYSIDESGRLMNYLNTHSEELSDLNSSKAADIRAELLQYSRGFSDERFRNIYNIKNSLDAHTIEYASMNILDSISSELLNAGIKFNEFYSQKTGIVCCYTDGYEGYPESDIKLTMFETDSYKKESIKAGDLLKAGDTAYKLITDENWKIIFPMEEEDTAEFGDQDLLKVGFSDKGFSVKCKFKTMTGADSRQYGVLSMNSYGIQFSGDRFIDFEIVTNDVSGLKIPVKSITKKDFYVIPSAFMTEDGNGNQGFYKAVPGIDGTAAEFVIPEIFNKDDEFCYIDCNESSSLQPGDYIMSSPSAAVSIPSADALIPSAESEEAEESVYTDTDDSISGEDVSDTAASETSAADAPEAETDAGRYRGTVYSGVQDLYQIADRRSLDGAYNVNKGYTVFKKVEVLESSNGYAIVKKGSSYGLQVYDHIVLDASTVSDGQLLFR